VTSNVLCRARNRIIATTHDMPPWRRLPGSWRSLRLQRMSGRSCERSKPAWLRRPMELRRKDRQTSLVAGCCRWRRRGRRSLRRWQSAEEVQTIRAGLPQRRAAPRTRSSRNLPSFHRCHLGRDGGLHGQGTSQRLSAVQCPGREKAQTLSQTSK